MPAACRIARTSISGAMSGAASGFDAICRAMSLSVIASTLPQFVAASASRAALLKVFAIALHLSSVRLAERNHPSLCVPVGVNAYKKPVIDEAESHLATLVVVKTATPHAPLLPPDPH